MSINALGIGVPISNIGLLPISSFDLHEGAVHEGEKIILHQMPLKIHEARCRFWLRAGQWNMDALGLALALSLLTLSSALAVDTLKICHIDDRSGAAAETGGEGYNGLLIAIDAANAAGGVAGKKLEVIAYDGKTDPQLTSSFATRCAEDDKALMIIGGGPTAPAASMIPVAAQFGIPYYMLAAGVDNLITTPPAPFHFRFGPSVGQEALAIADLLVKQGFKRVAFINNSLPYGTDGVRAVTTALDKTDVKIVTQQAYDISATDLSPQVINVREAKPDIIIAWSYPADAARVTRTLQQQGLKLPTILPRVGVMDSMRKLAGDTADGVLVPLSVDIGRPDVRKFFDTYNTRFKPIQPTYTAVLGYDAANAAVQVLGQPEVQQAINSGDLAAARKAIRDATEKVGRFTGLQGKQGTGYSFSASRHQGPPDTNLYDFLMIGDKGTKLTSADLDKFKPQ